MIELSWPDRSLFPNSRVQHRFNKDKRDKARNEAFYMVKSGAFANLSGRLCLHVSFFPPDLRRRDLDGMFSACKYYFDGIALALGVDDYDFSFKIERLSPVKGGKVVVKITCTENETV